MRFYISLVEDKNKRKLRLVHDAMAEIKISRVLGFREPQTYLQAYSIFDMKVAGAVVRGVSMMYATTVGNEEATASVIMAPDADQVKISIWPGVSKMM